MTITTARIYYEARSEKRTLQLNRTHWGFATWFKRRLKTVREQLRGPEAEGVDIVNFMLHEVPEHAWRPCEWARRGNTFNFSYVCNLSPLLLTPPVENIEKLMGFTAEIAEQAPWPQVRALAIPLSEPLSEEDKVSLLPYLKWPRPPELLY
ncbi:hypothetical protein MKD49_13710 [Herbaspirillum sp. WGmk3]|uniref:hypothetical protein n=1 Tax=Herbaspirillum sp. WGmk3 TaxID=2919925 RepID=UPI00209176F9|nr:hypothetical protein [Herbaspirillum sp. WGmk3]MCO4857538.1 hypothetical protein [Herbaspirillum sp. WGmk3]